MQNRNASFRQVLCWQLTTTSVQEKDAVDRSAQSEEPPLAGEGEGAAGSGDGEGEGSGDAGEASAGCWPERQMPQEVWHWVLREKVQGGAAVRTRCSVASPLCTQIGCAKFTQCRQSTASQ